MEDTDLIKIIQDLRKRVETLERRNFEVVGGVVYVGDTDGNVKIDGENKRILINDGSDDRVLNGYGLGLF